MQLSSDILYLISLLVDLVNLFHLALPRTTRVSGIPISVKPLNLRVRFYPNAVEPNLLHKTIFSRVAGWSKINLYLLELSVKIVDVFMFSFSVQIYM